MNDADRTPQEGPAGTSPHGTIDGGDHAALLALGRAWSAVDPVPSSLVETIRFGIALDAMMAEVATIQHEGARGPLAGVRGGSGVDAEAPGMTFATSDLSMTVMTSPAGTGRIRIDGWITPDDGGAIGLRLEGETRRHVPRGGRFWFDDVPTGHVQLFVESDDGSVRMITPAVNF